jgi:hypothetical protein
MSEWIEGKLKTFQEVRKNASRWIDVHEAERFQVYRSDQGVYLNVFYESLSKFGDIVEVKPWNSAWENTSSIYEDKEKEVGKNSQKYYTEWFEWIGEEPPIIEILPESLWDISDW